MLLTIFPAIVFCAAITLILLSAVAFIQDIKFFSSAPKEAREVLKSRTEELFYEARIIPKNVKRQEKTVLKEFLSSLMNGTHEYRKRIMV